MANQALQNTIFQHFQGNSQQTVTVGALISTFRQPRKTINQCLYGLSRRGLLEKVQDTPPLWKLKNKAGGIPSLLPGPSEQPVRCFTISKAGRSSQDPRDIAGSILQRLRLSPQPLAAIVLAKTISCEESTIQHLLDQLSQHDIVTNVGFQPVKWILKNDPGNSLPELDMRSQRGSPPPKIAHTEKGDDVGQARESLLEQQRDRFGAVNVQQRRTVIEREMTPRSRPSIMSTGSTNFVGSSFQNASDYTSMPLPPHLLVQRMGENVGTPQISTQTVAANNSSYYRSPFPSRSLGRGRGRGTPDYDRPSTDHFQERTSWKAPTCLGVQTWPSRKDDSIEKLGTLSPMRLSSDDTKSELEEGIEQPSRTPKCLARFSAEVRVEDVVKMEQDEALTVEPHLKLSTNRTSAVKTSTIPPSPRSLVEAERQVGKGADNKVLRAQASLLDALVPKQEHDYDVSSSGQSSQFAPGSYGPMGNSGSRREPQRGGGGIPASTMGLEVKDLSCAKLTMNSESFDALSRNPISVLTEHAQARKTSVEIKLLGQRGPPNKPKFLMAVLMGTRQFPSIVATNKKDGRKDAADAALRIVMAEGQFNKAESSPSTDVAGLSRTGTHFDKMASLSHQAFNLVAATVPENLSGRKVLAAMIMKKGAGDQGSVICLGTGNRCITGPEMSLEGHTVNDCHAEIITRRSFVRFLYKHLCNYKPNTDHPLFEQSPSGKLRIKTGISFHLYISTAPCGDGALFSPRDASDSKISEQDNRVDHEPTFSNNLQGILRTKIEGGEGTIPIEAGCHSQTWDGILRGERLRTMSCSDKVCRWNILGMQGALLANFMEPIYLSTLTLGCLYDHGHLSRAVCCRLEKSAESSPLPEGYQLNHPHLGRVTSYEPQRGTDKTKSISLNWCAGDASVEMVDGTLGQVLNRNRTDIVSRVAKKNLFAAYHVLKARLKSELPNGLSYKEAKEQAVQFQEAKTAMVARFKKSKFGNWVQKPIEEKMFTYQE